MNAPRSSKVCSSPRSNRLIRNRDRGKPHGSSPPTPPDMRVRIRRFGGLSYRPPVNLGIPSESK